MQDYNRSFTDHTRLIRPFWLLCLSLLAVAPQASASYVLGGVVTGETAHGWNRAANAAFRNALESPARFGPGGTVSTAITTVDSTPLGSLAGINGIVVPWWSDSSATAAMIAQLTTFFQNGGDLLIAADDSGHNPLNSALGIPTQSGGGSSWTGSSPLFNGPFGTVGSVSTAGQVGWFTPLDLSTHNGVVGAQDASLNATAALWAKGSYCSTCGALVLIGDVDVWGNPVEFLVHE